MFAKIPPICWKVLGIVFTSILAPVGIRHFDNVTPESPLAEVLPVAAPVAASAPPKSNTTPSVTRIVAKGSGSTADAAFQNAVNAALQQAVTAEVSALEWRLHYQSYLASLRHNGGGVLRGWQEVSNTSEHHLTGRVYHSEVAVEVDVEALRARLRSVDRVTRR